MAPKARFTLAVSAIALGTALALQPASINTGSGVVGLSTAKALDLGGSVGGGIGGDVGGSAGGGSLGGSLGADAGGSVGGSVGDPTSGGLGAGAGGEAALGGSLSGAASGGVGLDASAGAYGAASAPNPTGSVIGFVGRLFGFSRSVASSAQNAAQGHVSQLHSAATTAYEAAMLSGNVRGAAQAAAQISAGPVTAATVAGLNAQVGIEASDRFVALVVTEARRIQGHVPSRVQVNVQANAHGNVHASAAGRAPAERPSTPSTGAPPPKGGAGTPSRAPAKS